MQIRIYMVLLCLICCSQTFAQQKLFTQPQQQKQLQGLTDISNLLYRYLDGVKYGPSIEIGSEFFLIMLQADSSGRINEFHLLHDAQQEDSVFAILKHMTVKDFEKIRVPDCRGRMIVIPFMSNGTAAAANNYTDFLFRHLVRNIQQPPGSVLLDENAVMFARPALYFTPRYTPPKGTGKFIRVDSTQKQ